ncbi:unnamed protein product [Cyprideis torosa]|uniref:Uncharacterized protein n=1 Tax=Cyprideis torosa TaxID=163714 RepID=A0A7R8ZRP6_9CRUS|nr:unnamed protein product [Cyprideis torosa]CAG0894491.1 unnamed protein product [Cyprideis torosa]
MLVRWLLLACPLAKSAHTIPCRTRESTWPTHRVTSSKKASNKTHHGRHPCGNLLANFSRTSSDFLECFVQNSRPITSCIDCQDHFLKLSEIYQQLTVADDDQTKQHCIDAVLNADRNRITATSFSYLRSLYVDARCYNCFERHPDGSMRREMSNDTAHFFRLRDATVACIDSLHHTVPSEESTVAKNRSVACKECRDEYIATTQFFRSLQKGNTDINICMDIVDAMNATHIRWSTNLGCVRTRPSLVAPIIAICVVIFLPLTFYTGVKYTYDKKKTKRNGCVSLTAPCLVRTRHRQRQKRRLLSSEDLSTIEDKVSTFPSTEGEEASEVDSLGAWLKEGRRHRMDRTESVTEDIERVVWNGVW